MVQQQHAQCKAEETPQATHKSEVDTWVDYLHDIPNAASKLAIKAMLRDEEFYTLELDQQAIEGIKKLDAFCALKLGVQKAFSRAMNDLCEGRRQRATQKGAAKASADEVQEWVSHLTEISEEQSANTVKALFAEHEFCSLDDVHCSITEIVELPGFKVFTVGVKSTLKSAMQKIPEMTQTQPDMALTTM